MKSTLADVMKRWVLVHEIVHGILYEGNYTGDHNDDGVVIPLGTLIYLLLRDNDFYDDGKTDDATTAKFNEMLDYCKAKMSDEGSDKIG